MQESSLASEKKTDNFYKLCLEAGGEMGGLIKNYNWSATSMGEPGQWPASLITSLGIILHSKLPMFLFWGPAHICFYNDAYRPSFGNDGKHPAALGKKGEDVWPEIWAGIKPVIDCTIAGQRATFNEDILLPIYKNGTMEDVYRTFSYSAVPGDECKPAGVLVVCTETTEKVKTAKKLSENDHRYRVLIEEATVATALFEGRNMQIKYANDIMTGYWSRDYNVIGKTLKEVFPELENQSFFKLLNTVYTTGEPYVGIEEKADLLIDGAFKTFYFNLTYKALRNEEGEIYGIHQMSVDVTEQVLAKQKIAEAEEKARLAITSADLGVYEIVYATDTITTDSRFDKIWGFDKPVSRTDYINSIHPDDMPMRLKAHQTSLISGQLYYEAKLVRKDNSTHWIKVQGKVIFDEDGTPVKLIGVVQDITAQVVAQKKIEESEKSIRNMIIQAPVSMCILRGPSHVVEIANTRMFELWGKEEKELINKPVFEGLPEAREQGLEQLLLKVFTTGKRFVANERPVNLPRNNGIETVYLTFVYEALREGDGSISGIMAVALDVTAQVNARLKIEIAEERARLAISSADLGVYEVDLRTDELVTDTRYNEIFGFSYTASRKEFISVIHPNDLSVRKEAHKIALQTGLLDYEARIIKKNGSVSWIRAKGKVFFDEKGVAAKLLGVVQDITAQKQFAESLERKVAERTKELAETNLQLQQSNVELNQFAYIASHDLQEPLRKVRTFIELMQLSLGEVPEKTKVYISKIQNAAERMQTLIKDVLKFSLLSKERKEFKKVDLNAILQSVLSDYELSVEQKQAQITADELPVIEAIPLQMNQLFTNLISNSLKFSSAERQLTINIHSKKLLKEEVRGYKELNEDKVHYAIEFKDNGIGFAQENAEQIFTIFQRLHSRTKYEGTGIGLALCKKIVLNHFGIISANSRFNEGACFTIILPVNQN